jgi:hypothetical protein
MYEEVGDDSQNEKNSTNENIKMPWNNIRHGVIELSTLSAREGV